MFLRLMEPFLQWLLDSALNLPKLLFPIKYYVETGRVFRGKLPALISERC